jgi:hypothetical protein
VERIQSRREALPNERARKLDRGKQRLSGISQSAGVRADASIHQLFRRQFATMPQASKTPDFGTPLFFASRPQIHSKSGES